MEEQKKSQEEYAFLQERIKPSKITTKRILGYVIAVSILGLVFGVCASATFVMVKPSFESLVVEQESVQIPEDIEPESTPEVSEAVASTDVMEEVTLKIADIEAVNVLFTDIAKEVYPSLFSVYCKEEGILRQDTISPSDNELALNETTGVLVAQTSSELLILTSTQALSNEDEIYVESYGGYEYSAVVKKKDDNLGFAVVSVKKSQVLEEELEVATLANSNIVYQGDMVLVVGNQFGYNRGIAYGIVSSANHTLNLVDGAYKLLATDIPSVANGTGIMINMEGEVVGLVNERMLGALGDAPIAAIGISNMKSTIELLSNGNAVPYMGITGMAITESVADEYDIPMGYYVQRVEEDSPAMAAGIKSGDIIVTMNEEKTFSAQVYRGKVLTYEVDQEVPIVVKRMGQGEYVELECVVTVGSMQ